MLNNDFALWCRPEYYDAYVDRLFDSDLISDRITLINSRYDKTNHAYSIGKIAFLWANMDMRDAVSDDIICEADECDCNDAEYSSWFRFLLPEDIEKTKGQYIYFECVSNLNEDATITVNLSQDNEWVYSVSLTVVPGDNRYLIRCSLDYFWFYSNTNTVSFSMNLPSIYDNVMIKNVKVLSGT